MIRWLFGRIAASLDHRFSTARIDAAFAALPPAQATAPAQPRGTARVAALQVAARSYADAAGFVRDVDRYLSAACQKGCRLVCFPELFGLLPLTTVPPVRLALKLTGRFAGGTEPASAQKETPPLLLQLFEKLPFLTARYTDLMSRFAKRYGIWLSAGTLFTAQAGRVYNRHLFFGPDGALLAQQDKVHPVVEETALGLATGDAMAVVKTDIGNIALSVCMDATYFETFRVAKNLGADYIVVPIANMEPYHYWLALRGAQSRVSETELTAVKAALVSDPATGGGIGKRWRMPLELTGRAGIYFPLDSGIGPVEYAPLLDDPVVWTDLDIEALRGLHSDCFCLANEAVDNKYIDALIKRARKN